MSVAGHDAVIDGIDLAADPERWAVAAYRTALARSESATTRGDIVSAQRLLERAGGILTAARAPVEHARIRVAIGNCRRLLGDAPSAVSHFRDAVGLQAARAGRSEHLATLVDLGLALVESGRAAEATAALDEVIDRVGELDDEDDELRRVVGAALVNRAQAYQTEAGAEALRLAAADYRAAAERFDPASPQRGMALHGLGTVLLADGANGGRRDVPAAIDAFRSSLRILTAESFPFQHALAMHSLAIALEAEGTDASLRRAVDCVDAALAVFDPRLHIGPWSTSAATLERLAGRLGVDTSIGSRASVFVQHVAGLEPAERLDIVRERFGRIARQHEPRRSSELGALMASVADAAVDGDHDPLLRAILPVLMELPDDVLDGACRALCDAHRRSGRGEQLDAALDGVIHEQLHGPQRVRVRDLLSSHGWVRP